MNTLSIQTIQSILPQAYPFLLVDRILHYEKGRSLVALKNITADEWPSHSQSDNYIFPNTLLIEASAQAILILYHLTFKEELKGDEQFLLGRAKAEFFDPVHVGDEVVLNVTPAKILKNGSVADVAIFVKDKNKAQVQLVLGVRRPGS